MSQNNMPNSRPLRARVGLRCRESAHASTDVAPGCARCCRSAFCTPFQTRDWRRKKKEKKMRAFGLRSRRLYKNKSQNDQNLGGRQPRAVLPRRFRTNLALHQVGRSPWLYSVALLSGILSRTLSVMIDYTVVYIVRFYIFIFRHSSPIQRVAPVPRGHRISTYRPESDVHL